MHELKETMKNRQRSYITSQLMKRQICQLALLVVLLLTVVAILVWSTSRHIDRGVEEVISTALTEQIRETQELLFREDIYLTPDTAYLSKLEPCFYKGKTTEGYADLQKMQEDILVNIRKGVQYNSSTLRSTYLMLADETAPYVIRNGYMLAKSGLPDMDWMDACARMRQDIWVEWRTMPMSYLHSVPVVSVYRKITSRHWMTGEETVGYGVLNLDQNMLTSSIKSHLDGSECVYFYNESLKTGLYIGEENPEWQQALEALARTGIGPDGRWRGAFHGRVDGSQRLPMYYRVDQSYGNFLIIAAKVDTQLKPMLSSVYQVLVGILIICCLIILGLGYKNVRHLRNYDQGLRKLMKTAEAGEVQGMTDHSVQQNLNLVVERLLNNAIDVPELEAALQSEKELKTELQLLYGHTQINSHFLLNSLDSIYWASVRNNGVDSDESVMIENLCVILKFALDSSSLYTSLREEAEVTKLYLEIMRIRRKMPLEVIWEIPEELMEAKVSKLIMQPIVENCIQHASSREMPLRIMINAREENGVLILAISDNGDGMPGAEMRRFNEELKKNRSVYGRHIGMANVNRRIQVQYGPGYGIVLSAGKEGGLCVTMRMAYTRFVKTGL